MSDNMFTPRLKNVLEFYKFTITVYHVWSVEEKLLLGRALMG